MGYNAHVTPDQQRTLDNLVVDVLSGYTLNVHTGNYTDEERSYLFAQAGCKGCQVTELPSSGSPFAHWRVSPPSK